MSLHFAPVKVGAALAVCLGAIGASTPSFALDPWFDHIYPRYFFSGFEQSDTQGFFPRPTSAWHVENGNTYAVDDLGCDTPAHSWIQSGFVWFDYILQVSVQERVDAPFGAPFGIGGRGDCSAVGIHFRRTDFDNYYMFVLRGGDEAALLRVQDGVVDRELAVPYTYAANRWYVLRIKVEGGHALGYVNGTPIIEWDDDAQVRGTGGPSAWGTEAWFDNVISMPIYPIPHSGRPPIRAAIRGMEASGTGSLDQLLQRIGMSVGSEGLAGGDSGTGTDGGVMDAWANSIGDQDGDRGVSDEESSFSDAVLPIESWPQPSSGLAYLRFALPQESTVTVSIFDAMGRRVRSLLEGSLQTGTHDLIWDGRDDFGAATSAGIYYARLVTRDQVSTGRIVRIR